MNKLLIKIGISIVVLIIITMLVVKRFVYFQPRVEAVSTVEPHKEINQGHLHGWFFDGASCSGKLSRVVLFCHGNAGNISNRIGKVKALQELGYSVLIFDYSGYGQSDGIPSEQQCYDDACIMMALLLQTYKSEDIIVYGESLGAPIAAYTARRYNTPVLIIESGLVSMRSVIENKFPILSVVGFLFPEFNTESYLNGYKGRILMFHGLADEIINYRSIGPLKKHVTKFVDINGSHNAPVIPWEEVKRFCH